MAKKYYDTEFKQTIAALYDSGKTVQELKDEFNISLSSINRWKNTYGSLSSDSKIPSESLVKIKALEKELKAIKMERDILKKAVNIFAKSDR